MHFSAKRGLAIACRLSVCQSVTLVDCDHIGWNSSKIISRLTPCDLPFPQNGGSICPKTREWPYLSETGDPIHFMFGSRVGFQSRRIEWRYFRLHQIQVGGRPPSWKISNGHISATAHSIHLYIAHGAVIFAIAQLSCLALNVNISKTAEDTSKGTINN